MTAIISPGSYSDYPGQPSWVAEPEAAEGSLTGEVLTVYDFLDMLKDQVCSIERQRAMAVGTTMQKVDDVGSRLRLYAHAAGTIQTDIANYRQQLSGLRDAAGQLADGYGEVITGLRGIGDDILSRMTEASQAAAAASLARQEATAIQQELEVLSRDIGRLETEEAECALGEDEPRNEAEKLYLASFFEAYGQLPSQLKGSELAGIRECFRQARERLQEIEDEIVPEAAAQQQDALAAIGVIVTERWQVVVSQVEGLTNDQQRIEESLMMADVLVLTRMQGRLRELGEFIARHAEESPDRPPVTVAPVEDVRQGECHE